MRRALSGVFSPNKETVHIGVCLQTNKQQQNPVSLKEKLTAIFYPKQKHTSVVSASKMTSDVEFHTAF